VVGGLVEDAEEAAGGLDDEGLGAEAEAVVCELGDAAEAVAAHLGFGAVGVEHAHADGGVLFTGVGGGRADEDEAVGADAGVAVAHGAGECGPIVGGFEGGVGGVEVEVVVAEAVHFDEREHGGGYGGEGEWRRGAGMREG